jgi:hypothetical protein
MSEVYFLHEGQCISYEPDGETVDGAASAIGQVWSGLESAGFGGGIDAAVNWGNGKAYFFKADSYVKVDIATSEVEGGTSSLIVDKWAGMEEAGFGEGIDAAINYGDGTVYFFKGESYVPYSIEKDAVDGTVGSITGWGLPEGFGTDLDAVFNWGAATLYFVKGDRYAIYDIEAASAGSASSLAGDWRPVGEAGFGEGLSGTWSTAPPSAVRPFVFGSQPIAWELKEESERIVYVMKRLVEVYGYPPDGAAGLVGNLSAESSVIPSRLEGSAERTPTRAKDLKGKERTFTAGEVMNRNEANRMGPKLGGVGLAQWTKEPRRSGLFAWSFGGRSLGANVLYDMDTQIDYLVSELGTKAASVDGLLRNPSTSRADASDEVVFRFEIPEAVGGKDRSDPAVQAVFSDRRKLAEKVAAAFSSAGGSD